MKVDHIVCIIIAPESLTVCVYGGCGTPMIEQIDDGELNMLMQLRELGSAYREGEIETRGRNKCTSYMQNFYYVDGSPAGRSSAPCIPCKFHAWLLSLSALHP